MIKPKRKTKEMKQRYILMLLCLTTLFLSIGFLILGDKTGSLIMAIVALLGTTFYVLQIKQSLKKQNL